jgi:hypothetical protein
MVEKALFLYHSIALLKVKSVKLKIFLFKLDGRVLLLPLTQSSLNTFDF